MTTVLLTQGGHRRQAAEEGVRADFAECWNPSVAGLFKFCFVDIVPVTLPGTAHFSQSRNHSGGDSATSGISPPTYCYCDLRPSLSRKCYLMSLQ